ncbi:hypothetical protein B0H16DRAFT_1583769 [Mycena metata]|uniref:DUF5648 domain-containing protein n=1 Tax=Mycena metata TaxID=1033252 RepID=A0AAD7I0E2_9AGAR|nr:hypothetical protein B0H16DRAFT_1583769 [Mycena metata]
MCPLSTHGLFTSNLLLDAHHTLYKPTLNMKFALAVISALAVNLGSALSTHESQTRSSQTCGDPTLVVPLYRGYVAASIDHLYTTSVADLNADTLAASVDVLQGVAALVFATQEESTVRFYRLYSSAASAHFYTTSTTERDNAVSNGYVLQSELIYIYPTQICGSIPLFRLFSSAGKDYFYTTSQSEVQDFISDGYTEQGTAGYVFPVVGPTCG